jgi:hypothetical protein
LTSVRLDDGVTRADLRAELDKLPNGRTISVDTGPVISSNVRNGIDAEARGVALMALVAALAAIVALGQLLSRHARLAEADRRALGALGYSRPQIGAETIARAALPAVVGVVAGALAAILASGLFPPSFVREIEPDPGIRVDLTALVVGGALLVVAVLGWVAIAFVTTDRAQLRRGRARTTTAIANRAPSAAAATGTNFALTGREGSTTASLGTIAALALIVTGLVGATVFAVSLDNLVTEPGRFGMNFKYSVGDNSPLTAADLKQKLASDRDIDGMMILSAGQARAGDATVLLAGLDRVRGDLAPHVLSGRLPENPDEVALGRITGRQLHRGVGDELALRGSAGAAKLRVVGVVVVPTVGGNDGVGNGALVTLPGLARLDSEPSASLAALTLRSDASPDARKEIQRRTGAPPGLESRPGAIINVGRVRHIPAVLAVLLGALALLTMIHALVVSIQSRRRDVAVLRALGADRRWVARTVHWQATVLTVVPLVVAIPLGLLAGAVVYRAFVDRIGALPDPSLPGLLLAAMVLALVVIANLAALWPARRARRLPAATLLQSE